MTVNIRDPFNILSAPAHEILPRLEHAHETYMLDELSTLCDVAAVSAMTDHDYHSAYTEQLARMRVLNWRRLPATPLERDRLELLTGMDQADIFAREMNRALTAPALDTAAAGTRAVLLDRVLRDTTALLSPVCAWLNTGGNLAFAEGLSRGDNARQLLLMPRHAFAVASMRGPAVMDRVNHAFHIHNMEPLGPSLGTPAKPAGMTHG